MLQAHLLVINNIDDNNKSSKKYWACFWSCGCLFVSRELATVVATMAAEKAIICVLFEEFSEPEEIGINTCLILQNTLDVTVTALAVQNKREHPNRVKGFVETGS